MDDKLRIRSYTTTDYSPERIHQMGLSEVNRISSRMKEILTNQGYDSTKNVGQLMNELNENPDFLYADTPDRKEIIVKDYTEMVDGNTWENAFELAFAIYLDIINLLLEILEAMGNS